MAIARPLIENGSHYGDLEINNIPWGMIVSHGVPRHFGSCLRRTTDSSSNGRNTKYNSSDLSSCCPLAVECPNYVPKNVRQEKSDLVVVWRRSGLNAGPRSGVHPDQPPPATAINVGKGAPLRGDVELSRLSGTSGISCRASIPSTGGMQRAIRQQHPANTLIARDRSGANNDE